MGSVKDLVVDDSAAGNLYRAATPHEFGFGVWNVSGRFSVGDLKNKIPPLEVPNKGPALAMGTGAYFEAAANAGIESCYVGMLDADGNIVSTSELIDKGQTSNLVVMKLANVPTAKGERLTTADIERYHADVQAQNISVYVADAESIFRFGFPLGSSTFKRIANLTGRARQYERVATYEDTVALLDQIRTSVAHEIDHPFEGLSSLLYAQGLEAIPNPGFLLNDPVLNFTTKFDLAGDQDITEEVARIRMGLDEQGYAAWKELVRETANHQREYCAQRGVVNIDGKVEAVVVDRKPILTDFACTPDENRLMLPFERDGVLYLIPTNKEVQRAVFRARGIYEAIDQAKATYGDSWRDHLHGEFVSDTVIEEAARDSVEMMGDAIALVANRMLGAEVFEARRLEDWVDEFLPYASVVQPGQEELVRLAK